MATHISRLQTNSSSCTAAFTQIAGIEAIAGTRPRSLKWWPSSAAVATRSWRAEHREGAPLPRAEGAFYAFPNITGTGKRSKELEGLLLNEAGVACLSGTSFGEFGEGYLRFSYANSLPNIRKAIERMRHVLGAA